MFHPRFQDRRIRYRIFIYSSPLLAMGNNLGCVQLLDGLLQDMPHRLTVRYATRSENLQEEEFERTVNSRRIFGFDVSSVISWTNQELSRTDWCSYGHMQFMSKKGIMTVCQRSNVRWFLGLWFTQQLYFASPWKRTYAHRPCDRHMRQWFKLERAYDMMEAYEQKHQSFDLVLKLRTEARLYMLYALPTPALRIESQ